MDLNKLTRFMNSSFILSAVFILLSGCASMMGAPKSDNITIKTNPEGAEVYLGANLLGQTPLTYSFKRETFEQKTVTIRKTGYKTEEFLLRKTIEKKALYNLVFILTSMGVTSWGIDAYTGSMIQYSPDSYLIDLEKADNVSGQKDPNRFQRFRFVVLNLDNLKRDITSGGGDYLKAYFESRPLNITSGDYEFFQGLVSSEDSLLLSILDPIEFYTNLENI